MLQETVDAMQEMLHGLMRDLGKACRGNKTAAQRVRANTVKFAKLSKVYRKESLSAERGTKKKSPPKKRKHKRSSKK